MQKIEEIPTLCQEAMEEAKRCWDGLAKPIGSLGRLEGMVIRMAGIQGTPDVRAVRRKIVVFCADNGVTEEGVSGANPALSALLAAQIAAGRGNVSAMAKAAACEVVCVDVGLFSEETPPLVLPRKVRRGTRNFAHEPAMTEAEALRAIRTGEALAMELSANGTVQAPAGNLSTNAVDLLLAGEVGMGNTTTSAAVAAALLHLPANALAGRGSGLDDAGLSHKVQVIEDALKRYELGIFRAGSLSCSVAPNPSFPHNIGESLPQGTLNRVGNRVQNNMGESLPQGTLASEALRVLCCVGGFDIAAMAGFYIGCAKMRVPAILDGAISAAAALVAERLAPGTKQFLFASHRSREPMATLLLAELGLTPILEADLALGEGTGAVCLLPLIDLALAAYRGAATFAESGMGASQEGGGVAYHVNTGDCEGKASEEPDMPE